MMMMFYLFIILIFLTLIRANIYLYFTEDSSSVEYYDCVFHQTFFYCRRPKEPFEFQRANMSSWKCLNNGIRHRFSSMYEQNISINTVIHQWKSTLEMADRYAQYRQMPTKDNDQFICQCQKNIQSFGKFCEYLFPFGETLIETIDGEIEMRKTFHEKSYRYTDILCYKTLQCHSSLLCLDWRDICDGIQQCLFGFDEENCDRLEFNECDENEYRCMNGMCIPNEYFLDGEYDCMDLSDEKFDINNLVCTYEQARLECDEKFCLPNQWSCGDGQCIPERLAFLERPIVSPLCLNQRDHVFLCELVGSKSLWTLSNGQCSPERIDYEDSSNQCIHLLKCSLTYGLDESCPCNNSDACFDYMWNECQGNLVYYPQQAVIAPYLFVYFDFNQFKTEFAPFYMKTNGTIKCREEFVDVTSHDDLPLSRFNSQEYESKACFDTNQEMTSQTCFNNSRTFNNKSYYFLDVCIESRECLSAYRIRDGFSNCFDESDENSSEITCRTMTNHRFQCSNTDPSCLMINSLGNFDINCKNKYDESWLGTGATLSKMICSSKSKDDCQTLREYIQISWTFDPNSHIQLNSSHIIPFRAYCDSFWDFYSKMDEDKEFCRTYWICLDSQWQCRNGQCIEQEWILDGEWDCADASDEEAIFIENNHLKNRNLKIISQDFIHNKFNELYRSRPFSNICYPEKEFPCFRINSSYSIENNFHSNRPCIPLEKLGDGQIDCLGALDEQNTEEYCQRATMLGKNYKCLSTNTCILYSMTCNKRCPTSLDDQYLCYTRNPYMNCSNSEKDITCFDGQCLRNGRCNREDQCSNKEDEYLCETNFSSQYSTISYRREKELGIHYENQPFHLPNFPFNINETNSFLTSPVNQSNQTDNINTQSLSIAFQCNRGIGIYSSNKSIVCFCPQQYYGEHCEYYNDRLTFLFHMNFSQSIYTTSNDLTIVLKVLVLFLYENQILSSYEFHARPTSEMTKYFKKLDHVVYSRTNQSLERKRSRYANRRDILEQHPYTVRIEAYEIVLNAKAKLIALWQYPIYFDYLPAFRLSKVLYLTKPDEHSNPCTSNPCRDNQICQQILNEKSKFICLCREGYYGENCTQFDRICSMNYCSSNALCKPTYRGLLNRHHLPYCICPKNVFGFQCYLQQDQCQSNPCSNNGTCFQSATPGTYFCVCNSLYQGTRCEFEKNIIRLEFNQSKPHRAATVQYFHIDFTDLSLRLDHQQLYQTLPKHLFYRHNRKFAPEFVVLKLYIESSHSDIYLISLQTNVVSIKVLTELTDYNRCQSIDHLLPFQYHRLCLTNQSLLCFHDRNYLCVCDSNHTRADCFIYDHSLDQCSSCLSSGRCIKDSNEFLCLCSSCHSGRFCQFSSESFSFTLDQLFSADLLSTNQTHRYLTIFFLTIGSLMIFFLGLINNIFSFLTFSQQRCRRNGSGQYLLLMSIINQINLGFLTFRLCHLTINITSDYFSLQVNIVLCTVLNYFLTTTSRISQWLVSLLAIERVYTVLFLNKHWLRKPEIARRLIAIAVIGVLITGAYEIRFVSSHSGLNNNRSGICFLEFPVHQTVWSYIHQFVRIINALIPFLINLCSMMMIIYVVIKKKMKANRRNIYVIGKLTGQVSPTDNDNEINVIKSSATKISKFQLFREVLTEHKELVLGPAFTLVPQLFSLPLFIISILLVCQTIETNPLRYLLIFSYFISFIPQIITFFLYISPSTMYMSEWRNTNIYKRIQTLKNSNK